MAHFNISAAVVYQLGEELISDEVTALLELVKNSFDADADYVNIVIDTQATSYEEDGVIIACPNGFVSIEDNGTGMTMDEIVDGWLVISVSRKREMKLRGKKTDNGRTPMGDKGLGRLSTQRLGNVLNMITSTEGEYCKRVVSFDWQDFRSQRLLTDVRVNIEEIPSPQETRGTKLVITEIRELEAWQGNMRQSIQTKLSQLISPFDEARAFQVFLTIDGEPIEMTKIATRIRQAASGAYQFEYFSKEAVIIKGALKLSKLKVQKEIDAYNRLLAADQGREFFNFISDPNSKFYIPGAVYLGHEGWFIGFRQEIALFSIGNLNYINFLGNSEFADPGRFKGEIDDFRLDASPDEIAEGIFDKKSEYKEFIDRQHGIRVFRDGFGIRPFGYQGNDWLKLGSNQTSGNSFYGLRPNNVMGYVSLEGDENKVLKEKTDREGFVENEYSRNFFLLMGIIRDRINSFVEAVRRSYNKYKELRIEEDSGLGSQTLSQTLELLQTTSQDAGRVERQIGEMLSAVEDTEQAIQQITDIVSRQSESSTALATTNSDMHPVLANMQKSIAQANRIIKSTKELLPKINRLDEIAKVLAPKIIRLEEQIDDFTELASLGLVAEGFTHELVSISNNLDARTSTIEKSAKPLIGTNRELRIYLEYVRMSVSSIRKQLSHLAPSLKYVREKQDTISIKPFVEELIEFYSNNNKDINFVIKEPFDDFAIIANKGKMTQIIDNLVINSVYWLRNYKKSNSELQPEISFSAYDQTLVIWDNGLGVDKAVEYNLFQSFVTTKPKGVGRGLGLYIVTQLLDTLDSEIILLPERNILHGRRYKFALILKGALKNG